MPTSLFPISIPISGLNASDIVHLPFYQEATLWKAQAHIDDLGPGAFSIDIFRDTDLILSLAPTPSAIAEAVIDDVLFGPDNVLRVDTSGTVLTMGTCHLTLWFRMQIN